MRGDGGGVISLRGTSRGRGTSSSRTTTARTHNPSHTMSAETPVIDNQCRVEETSQHRGEKEKGTRRTAEVTRTVHEVDMLAVSQQPEEEESEEETADEQQYTDRDRGNLEEGEEEEAEWLIGVDK